MKWEKQKWPLTVPAFAVFLLVCLQCSIVCGVCVYHRALATMGCDGTILISTVHKCTVYTLYNFVKFYHHLALTIHRLPSMW